MKKLITIFAFIALSTVSAKAADLGIFSVTAGFAANQGVFGATAKETARDEDDVLGSVNKESGVFTDSYGSQFIEVGLGSWISLGYEHTPDSISTPQNVNNGNIGTTATSTVSVDFNDMNTAYLKLNTPYGVYFKYGTVSTDIDIKETQQSGNTYQNKSVDGESMGIGYQTFIKDTGFGIRFEGSYLELDNVSVDNGVAIGAGTPATGGRNQIDASNLEGLAGKVALTYTFGRSGNSF